MSESTKPLSNHLVIGLVTPEYLASDVGLMKPPGCHALEFRGDLFGEATSKHKSLEEYRPWVTALRQKWGHEIQILHTLRLQRDGGRWPDSQSFERLAIWSELTQLSPEARPDWVDMETEALERDDRSHRAALLALKAAGIRVLLSHHRFQAGFLANDFKMLDAMAELNPDGVKFALTVHSEEEALEVLQFAAKVSQEWKVSGVFAMGPLGQPTRLAAPLVGCPFTYGTLGGAALAPGQMPVTDITRGIDYLQTRFQGEKDWTPDRIQALWSEAKQWLRKDLAC